MLVNLLNKTEYKKIRVLCEGREYQIEQNKTVTIDVQKRFSLKVFTGEKNRTLFNWLFLLIDGFVDEDSIINTIYYDAEFDLEASDSEGVKTISIETLEKRNDSELVLLYSVYLYSDNVVVLNTQYIPTDTKKQQRKSRRYLICLSSLLWAIIPFIIGAIYYGTWWIICVIVFLLVFFTIPSLKKLCRVKRFFSEDHIIASLKEKENEYRANGGNPAPVEPNGLLEKTFYKVLDKIFKGK